MPWRRTTDPYHIWVSEVMLQQTQVATVVPYFNRFVERFPTTASLADSSRDEVLCYWQGLGYYRRANHLHCAAQYVVQQFGGRVPSDARTLRRLPGVGRYIAGAIQSFAFGMPAAILEANSARVLCRLFAVRSPLQSPVTNRLLWALAGELLCREAPGLHNQALMELGALVCIPGQPRCEKCPVKRICRARKMGLTAILPQTVRRPSPIDVCDAAAIIRSNGRVLIVRRPLQERWGGLWELPRTTVDAGSDPRAALRDHVQSTLGLDIEVGFGTLTVKHGVTHHRITLTCYESQPAAGRLRARGYDAWQWVTPALLTEYPCSSPQRKVFTFLQKKH